MKAKLYRRDSIFSQRYSLTPKWRPSENHIYYISICIIAATLAFNRLVLPPEWATSEAGNQFVEIVLPLYPGLRELKENWAGYTPQLAVMFSLMFASIPIHFLLGLCGSFALTDSNYKKCICDASWKHFNACTALLLILSFIPFFSTHVNGFGRRMPFTNQASDNFIVLAYTWILFLSIPYGAGKQFGLVFQKAKFWHLNSN